MGSNLFGRARDCLCCDDVDEKLARAASLRRDWENARLELSEIRLLDVVEPGRPLRPLLVHPREVPRRSFVSPEGRLALIHAVAHIEFNAINLACDAIFRFRDMPRTYYDDWVQVVAEEAAHFHLLRERLRADGREYGDYPAHNGLWEMALNTADDVVARMALVPRVLEARSLDVVPGIVRKLRGIGDHASAEVLELIEREEVAHVAAGSRWFRYACELGGLEPVATFKALIEKYMKVRIKGPFRMEARRAAGFDADEITLLEELGG
ncbi:MAG: ferritin-like domain-containing protein [Gammaproteobacteria bacterium]|nr:ferritin-like domain-containing protein [Gammaproteobacteria bacterium]